MPTISSSNGDQKYADSDNGKSKYNGSTMKKRDPREKPKMAETWPEMYKAWPMSTILIVANEFFQKFASLGTVLTLYLMNGLRLSENQTYIFFNLYSVFGGIFPLLGSILADGYIGKFRTILYSTVFYGVGKIVMAAASIFPPDHYMHPWGDLLGISIITIGMGGIVPCVASFGGDQFEPYEERMISIFFSLFYAAINAGAMISTIMLPILRSQSCLGQDSCFPLSFAVSAFFMIFASILFIVGSRSYKKQPPEGNVFGDVFVTTKIAIQNRQVSCTPKKHWLDHYFDTHDCRASEKCLSLQKRRRDPTACERQRFVDDIKALLRILVMYLPIPMFWALYDQQYSVWLVQSIQMDCRIWGDILFLPDQMQFVNPVLILVFIALFESFLYPICSKFCKLTPLKKMVAGGVVASMAFVVSAILQLKVNTTLPELPNKGLSFVSVVNTFDNCDLNVTLYNDDGIPVDYRYLHTDSSLVNNKLTERRELFEVNSGNVTWSIEYIGNSSECDASANNLPTSVTYEVESEQIHYIYVGRMGTFIAKTNPAKPTLGTGEFSLSISMALTNETCQTNLALCRVHPQAPDINNNATDNSTTVNIENSTTVVHPCDPLRGEDFYFFNATDVLSVPYTLEGGVNSTLNTSIYKFRPIRPGTWRLYYVYSSAEEVISKSVDATQIKIAATPILMDNHAQGGVYVLIVTGPVDQAEKRLFRVVPDNSVSILWQIPQIAVITAAEILFSVTGYEFSYSQSGKSMKSLVQALWFLTVSVGDLIIVFVALVDFKDLAAQSLIYSGAMLVVTLILALLSIYYYEYRDTSCDDDDEFWEEGEDEEAMRKRRRSHRHSTLVPLPYPQTAPAIVADSELKKRRTNEFDNHGYESKGDDPWNAQL